MQDLRAQDKAHASEADQEAADDGINQAELTEGRQSQEDLQAQLAQVSKTAIFVTSQSFAPSPIHLLRPSAIR